MCNYGQLCVSMCVHAHSAGHTSTAERVAEILHGGQLVCYSQLRELCMSLFDIFMQCMGKLIYIKLPHSLTLTTVIA